MPHARESHREGENTSSYQQQETIDEAQNKAGFWDRVYLKISLLIAFAYITLPDKPLSAWHY
jgi:hypothetical protein